VKWTALLGDEAQRRAAFPIATERVFLAHAAVCPLPSAVVEAMSSWAGRAARLAQFEYLHADEEAAVRTLAAEMIGGGADEISIQPSTSAALSMVAEGLDWRSGDSVVVADRDFPANLQPWFALERLGVKVVRLPRREDGTIEPEDVLGACDDSTRLVSLSSAHFGVGTPIDVEAIGRALRARDILFCLDAIQTLGAVTTRSEYVDFLAADAHKWLLGPQGVGILWVRREVCSRLRPALVGWKSVVGAKEYGSEPAPYWPDARRFEPGSLSPINIVGLRASLRLLGEVGDDQLTCRVVSLRDRARDGLEDLGFHLLGPPRGAPTGILACRPPDGSTAAELHRALDQRHIVTSLRSDLRGDKCLRIAPHFYNTEEDIDFFLASCRELIHR
jgi:selenocysteine lyase/cysteine desulfurase